MVTQRSIDLKTVVIFIRDDYETKVSCKLFRLMSTWVLGPRDLLQKAATEGILSNFDATTARTARWCWSTAKRAAHCCSSTKLRPRGGKPLTRAGSMQARRSSDVQNLAAGNMWTWCLSATGCAKPMVVTNQPPRPPAAHLRPDGPGPSIAKHAAS